MPEIRVTRLPRVAVAAVLAIVACVSLTPPRGGGANVPVVRGVYKPGSEQIVRIALETSAKELPAGMRPGSVGLAGDGFVSWNGKRYRGTLEISQTDSGYLVVNNLPMDSYLRGVVPLEIGSGPGTGCGGANVCLQTP